MKMLKKIAENVNLGMAFWFIYVVATWGRSRAVYRNDFVLLGVIALSGVLFGYTMDVRSRASKPRISILDGVVLAAAALVAFR